MNDVRIQIVNYKTKKYLEECLVSLEKDLKDSSINYSVAILDNASGDNLSNIKSTFPGLRNIEVYQGEKNLGFGAGQNFLSTRGKACYLLFLNPDTKIIEAKTVEKLLKFIKESRVQIVGPRLVTDKGKTQWYDHGELHSWRAHIALNTCCAYWQKQENITEVAWISGATFLIEKKWFDELGGFDENFFLYREEEELCWRLRAKGDRVLYNPSITILHHGSVVAKKSEHIQKSTDYFLKKHFRKRSGSILRFLNRVINWSNLC